MLCRQNCFVIIMDGSFVQVLINNVTVSLKTGYKMYIKLKRSSRLHKHVSTIYIYTHSFIAVQFNAVHIFCY